MKINAKFEQAIIVMSMLALQKKNEPIKSSTLSEKLKVSDSYLKKILAMLTKANLIQSVASKNGGYLINDELESISLLQIYQAIDNNEVIKLNHLAKNVFIMKEHAVEMENKLLSIIEESKTDFENRLQKIKLTDLLIEEMLEKGVDWNEQ